MSERIGIVGLGYVGLPLAVAFAQYFDVIGFDLSSERVDALKRGEDETGESENGELNNPRLNFTSNPEDLRDCTFIVVAVPTPITTAKEPDLTALRSASQTVGAILSKGAMVVYESTVYPGVTEEVCLPILEEESGLKLGDFDLGYSPERVNPGDKQHKITDIVKVVSGHSEKSADRACAVYGKAITAGIHRAQTIKTAEAAKVIENVQRDLNIALMNELSQIFSRLNIRTQDVLDAAATKWNFHRYHPGLVGGHCIGVDPYYLTHRALALGYSPEVILAGRRINDSMGHYVGDMTMMEMKKAGCKQSIPKVWVLGVTFKENVPDFRNTRAIDVIELFKKLGCEVRVWEPLVSPQHLKEKFDLEAADFDEVSDLDAVVLINGHDAFSCIDLETLKSKMRTPVLVDVKNFFSQEEAEKLGFVYRSL